MWLVIGFNYFDGLFGTFIYFVKIIFFTIWLEHVVMHCWAKSLKTVLRLMIFWNVVGLSMLRIITVAVLAIWMEFRLCVVFCWNIIWYTVATFSWFLRRVAAIGIILGQETRQVVCLSRGCNADTVEKIHGRISGGHSRDFAQYCKFIQPCSMSVFFVTLTTLIARPVYTRDPHSLFIVPADGLALSGTTSSAWAVAGTKLHMYV